MKNHLRFDVWAGLAAAAAILAAACPAHAQVTETVLYNFTGGKDGANPGAPLLADNTGPSGALRGLYGTTLLGPNGSIFKLTPPKNGQTTWSEQTRWDFTGGAGGNYPLLAGVFAGTRRISRDTPLYGTTLLGGNNDNGIVYGLTGKAFNVLWTFTGGADGGGPCCGDVVADKAGALYVSAENGGSQACYFGCGTVIQLTPPAQGQTTWTETTIWSFTGGSDGAEPNQLIIDANGVLYGTGAYGGSGGAGTVFKLTPPTQGQTTWTEQTLYSFQGGNDGNSPEAPLTFGPKGELYGTTASGGVTATCSGCGTVFRLIPPRHGRTQWKEEVLWSFTGGADSANPEAAVILDKVGAVYGTAPFGATAGAAFKLTPPAKGQTDWTETTLWDFSGGNDGAIPTGGLTADKNGILYGATNTGGANNSCGGPCGVVYSLTGTGYVP
jgi:uncharacterized protein YceK